MIKLLGFLPDIDPTTPGVMKSCNGIIPTVKGMMAAPSELDAGVSAASAETNALAVMWDLAGDKRTFTGTITTLEEEVGGAWVDRSRATPVYAVPDSDRWSFASFGNYVLASNIADLMQVSETTTFADIADSPKAAYIAVSDGFVMAVSLSTNTDGWHCSAYLDHTDWTEAVSTQCTSGRVIGGDGGFTGLKSFGTGFVAWKKNSTYIANYVGAPIVFQWTEIQGAVGCPTGHAAVSVEDRVIFLGNDDFYIFDGANNVPIGNGIREWFFSNSNPKYIHRTIAVYNENSGNVTWHYVGSNSDANYPNEAIVYNIQSQKWGKYSLTIEAAAAYYTAGLTYESIGSAYATYDDLPTDISYDSPYWTASAALSGVIKTDHILYTLSGDPSSSTFTLNTIGNDELYTTINRVRPRFLSAPESSTITYSYDDSYGDSFTQKGTFNLTNGKYDLLHSARWHEVKFNFVGTMEIIGAEVKLVGDGEQ